MWLPPSNYHSFNSNSHKLYEPVKLSLSWLAFTYGPIIYYYVANCQYLWVKFAVAVAVTACFKLCCLFICLLTLQWHHFAGNHHPWLIVAFCSVVTVALTVLLVATIITTSWLLLLCLYSVAVTITANCKSCCLCCCSPALWLFALQSLQCSPCHCCSYSKAIPLLSLLCPALWLFHFTVTASQYTCQDQHCFHNYLCHWLTVAVFFLKFCHLLQSLSLLAEKCCCHWLLLPCPSYGTIAISPCSTLLWWLHSCFFHHPPASSCFSPLLANVTDFSACCCHQHFHWCCSHNTMMLLPLVAGTNDFSACCINHCWLIIAKIFRLLGHCTLTEQCHCCDTTMLLPWIADAIDFSAWCCLPLLPIEECFLFKRFYIVGCCTLADATVSHHNAIATPIHSIVCFILPSLLIDY